MKAESVHLWKNVYLTVNLIYHRTHNINYKTIKKNSDFTQPTVDATATYCL